MPIALTDKIVALLASLTDEQIEALPPAERRRLEHACMSVMVRCGSDAGQVECDYSICGLHGQRAGRRDD